MPTYRFRQVDVFSSEPFRGNPVAVVDLSQEEVPVSDERMREFARWTNLSETTFLLPPVDPAADYRLRIFTPGGELPFAGHPTLGSCAAWLAETDPGRRGTVVQECGIGLVELRVTDAGIAFAAPPLIRGGAVDDADLEVAVQVLGLTAADVVSSAWVDNGPGWLGLLLRDVDTVLGLTPDFAAMAASGLDLGVAARFPEGGPADLEVRAFVPDIGVAEDPVTGSLNAGLAVWLLGNGTFEGAYTARQGTAMGRNGRIDIRPENERIWVGGATRILIQGTVEF